MLLSPTRLLVDRLAPAYGISREDERLGLVRKKEQSTTVVVNSNKKYVIARLHLNGE